MTESTVDTLGHIKIVSSRPPRSILPSLRFDGDRLSWANSFTEFTSWMLASPLNIDRDMSAGFRWVFSILGEGDIVKNDQRLDSPIHLSSPLGYLLRACSPLNRGDRGPFSNGYMMVYGGPEVSLNSYMTASHI